MNRILLTCVGGLVVSGLTLTPPSPVRIKVIEPYRSYLSKANYATYPDPDKPGAKYWKFSTTYRWPSQTKVSSGDISNATRVGNGQCVSFASSISNRPTLHTAEWSRDVPLVLSNGTIRTDLTLGTLLATMDGTTVGDRYDVPFPHVTIFIRRVNSTTIEVVDQNFVASRIVGKHQLIKVRVSTDKSPSNARRYWAIKG